MEDKEKRDYGAEFEEEVKSFLKDKLGLSDVKGGSNFHIGGTGEKNQIDACGRYKNILFIFECKASGRQTKRSMRQDILATETRRKIAFETYKTIPEYSHCKLLRYIFITKKITLSNNDKELIKDRTNLWYVDSSMLDYYSELQEKIGKYAVYNFLSEFKIRPSEKEQLNVLATKTKLGEFPVYSFFARPKDLLRLSYVARRWQSNENYYQRMLDKARIGKISRFLNAGGVFPTNVIISLKDGDTYFKKFNLDDENNVEVGNLSISNSYSACWIIDGQHRLYSFTKSESEALVPCIAFTGISIDKERSFFLEINREQRPIQADLIWDLEGLADEKGIRGRISNIVRTLDSMEESPFYDSIYIPVRGNRVGKKINMAAFCNGLLNSGLTKENLPHKIGGGNPVYDQNHISMRKRVCRILSSYFSAVKECLDDKHSSFLLGNAGVPMMLYLLEPIISFVGRAPTFSEFDEYARAIKDFFEDAYPSEEDVRELKSELNSEGARKKLSRDIGRHIRKVPGKKRFWPNMEETELIDNIVSLERRLALLISDKLSSVTSDWIKQRIPQDIYMASKRRMKTNTSSFEETLGLGDELSIIIKPNNWEEVFKDIFIGKGVFIDQNEFMTAYRYLTDVRADEHHGKSVTVNKEKQDLCRIYLQRFDKVVPELSED